VCKLMFMISVTATNVDEIMRAVSREMGQLPVLRARVQEAEADLVAVFAAVEASGVRLPRELEFRMNEVRERHARRTRRELSAG